MRPGAGDMRRIVVYGASGHAKVVADALVAGGARVAGFLDDRPELHGRQVLGLPVLGGREWLDREARQGGVAVALGIGVNNSARREVARYAMACGAELA